MLLHAKYNFHSWFFKILKKKYFPIAAYFNLWSTMSLKPQTLNRSNCIGGVMVSMLASSAVDHGFEPL